MGKRIAGILLLLVSAAVGADWPQWGGDDSRNMASNEKGLPASFEITRSAKGEVDVAASRNIRWAARLGTQSYGGPTVAGGKVFVGTNNSFMGHQLGGNRGGAIVCFDEATGKLLWRLFIPRFVTSDPLFNFDNLSLGVCSTPTVDGDRVYVVSSRCELLCLDVNGQANGNDGEFKEESAFQADKDHRPAPLTPLDGDILWRVDMIHDPQINVWVQDAADCSVLVHGDLVYVCPSNGVNKTHKEIPRPNAPSLIAFDKRTGKLIARDDEHIAPRIFHGEWSSPALLKVGDRTLIIHGGGDGVCYAFDATPSPGPDGKMYLKKVWWFDCNPPRLRLRDGKVLPYRDPLGGPSEVIATPVVYKNRVYVAVGQDPRHKRGPGNLVCIDATGTGDVTKTHQVWAYDRIERTLSTVSIADGLLYVADFGGRIHCLDTETGQAKWIYETRAAIWGSTMVADGKVYIGTERNDLLVLAAGPEMKLLSRIPLGKQVYTTPVAANGRLYLVTLTHLYAIQSGTPAR